MEFTPEFQYLNILKLDNETKETVYDELLTFGMRVTHVVHRSLIAFRKKCTIPYAVRQQQLYAIQRFV